jgi:pantetheine-phosphate adenylyltransferase
LTPDEQNPEALARERKCPKKIVVYPGTFDPITYGHLDLLDRSLKVFDKVIVAIADNPAKKRLFTLEERKSMIQESLADHSQWDRIRVDVVEGLLVEYVARAEAQAIIRGLRAVSDFEFEFQMALMNRRLNRNIETFFMMTGMRWIFISSTIIKEVVISGGSVEGLVPPPVEARLAEKLLGIKRG